MDVIFGLFFELIFFEIFVKYMLCNENFCIYGFNKVFLKMYLNEMVNVRKFLIFIFINIYIYDLYIYRMNFSNEGI